MKERLPDEGHAAPRLILFIVGDEANSKRARANLSAFRAEAPEADYELEVVDVLEDYKRALEYDVVVAPALVVLSENESTTILGDLSDREALRAALRRGEVSTRER